MVKLWIIDQIKKIQHKKNMGFILPVVADAKIELLNNFYDDFNLDTVTFEFEYHDQI